MHVREANLEDKEKWDSFVDNEEGSFFHYFDWKHVYEAKSYQYIALILENTASQIIGILPIVKEKGLLYSSLNSLPEGASGGFLLKKDLTNTEKVEALTMLLRYVDANYSRGCYNFTLKENLSLMNELSVDPTSGLIDNGFHFRYDRDLQFPCTYILELRRPFEEKIWKGLWSSNLRNQIRKAKKLGVVVITDRSLHYIDDFIDMLSYTFEHHGSVPMTKDEIMVRMNVFSHKTKLFLGLLDEKPIAAILCHYTPSTCYISKLPTLEEGYKNYAPRLLQFVAIEDACNSNYKFVEFGTTAKSSLSYWKELFKGTKVSMRIYERRYSTPKAFVERAVPLVKHAWNDKRYFWDKRRELIGKIMRFANETRKH